MITIFIILYNIFRINRPMYNWLNLNNKEGLNTALIAIFLDVLLLRMLYILLN